MFGKIEGAASGRKEVEGVEILALMEGGSSYVVASTTRLMGALERNGAPDIIVFNSGDEITLETDDAYPEGTFDICIILHNTEYAKIGKKFYFTLAQLEGRKIEIDGTAIPKYS